MAMTRFRVQPESLSQGGSQGGDMLDHVANNCQNPN